MNSTLYNGYSGIKTHQFGLDALSNNIANINTTGYRANVPEFKSLFSSALNSASPNSPITSDMNYGATTASNAISNVDGSYKESDGEFDIAYAGKGWFVVGNSENNSFDITEPNNNIYYTRDGSFTRDAQGYLVNSSGYYMMGVNLGKIDGNIFRSDTQNDVQNLATSTITPLQIPQDLHYGPSQSTKVDVALNLNKNQGTLTTVELFKDTQGENKGKLNEAKLLNQDISSIIVDNESFNASVYNDVIIKVKKGDVVSEYSFTYGGDSPNGFKSFAELKRLIKEQIGLDLGFAKLPNGDINPSLMLELTSDSLSPLNVELGGKLFEKLGFSGEKELNMLNVSQYSSTKVYNPNDLVKVSDVIFKRLDSPTSSSPIDDTEAWVVVDSTNAPLFRDEDSYPVNSIVKYEGKLYAKLSDEKANINDESVWREIGDSRELKINDFNKDDMYARNSFVYYNNQIYRKISDNINESSNPSNDLLNWEVVQNNSFLSNGLNVANYKTTTEMYNKNGDKLLVISKFILSHNDAESQTWSVESAIYDREGNIRLGDIVESDLTFSSDGKLVGQNEALTLKYGDEEISYNVSGVDGKSSSAYSYMDSQVYGNTSDGSLKGDLVNVSIDENGVINLAFSNGKTEAMGRVAIAAFVNDQGLSKVGNNMLQVSSYVVDGEDSVVSSGMPIIGWDENGNLRFGQVLHKYLETSNVNPADAMTDLIVYQRGYAMNAKAFTTGDDLIKEAINLKR